MPVPDNRAVLEIEHIEDASDELLCLAQGCKRRAEYSFFTDKKPPWFMSPRVTFLCNSHGRAFLEGLRALERVTESNSDS